MASVYLIGLGVLEGRRRKTSFALTLREYPPSQRRQWRRAVKRLNCQGASGASTAAQPSSAIDEVPTVFLLAEKMRLESMVRMQPFVIALGCGWSIGMGLLYWAGGDRAGAIAYLVWSIFAFGVFMKHRVRNHAPDGVGRGRLPRLIRSYEYALELRGK
ncbi:hypothetical protein [Ferrimicrobium sp.]|uniref:hypothetical protein n=1 Tax=Ferrimicrobium sp. TaxID=2926050 RepID=UPI00260D2A90|nr:hypothetical protein [Ferrimicrobium sp.]